MDCAECSYPDTRVVKTTQDDRSNQVFRRRECIKCGQRFTTREHERDDYRRSDYKTPAPRRILDK